MTRRGVPFSAEALLGFEGVLADSIKPTGKSVTEAAGTANSTLIVGISNVSSGQFVIAGQQFDTGDMTSGLGWVKSGSNYTYTTNYGYFTVTIGANTATSSAIYTLVGTDPQTNALEQGETVTDSIRFDKSGSGDYVVQLSVVG
ncbi:MAG: hypothetical protein EBS66_18370, partial [Betaproteobacteria bacterium]|nr:hypothetical protein [Betaproteobacteria bacterium]